MKAILSYPFSGSIYSFFHEKIRNIPLSESPRSYHSYYKTLYGKKPEYFRDLALTLLILYDQVYLAPADHEMPEMEKYQNGNDYKNLELGLSFSWSFKYDHQETIGSVLEDALRDEEIGLLLNKVPQNYWSQILSDSIIEIELSKHYRAPIIAYGGRRKILKRLFEIKNEQNRINDKKFIVATSEYINTISLNFSPYSIENLGETKNDRSVREYSKSYSSIINSLINGSNVKSDLNLLLKNSLEKENLIKRTNGFLESTSIGLSLLSLIPPLNVLGIGSLISSAIAKLNNEKPLANWHQFGFQIKHIKDKRTVLEKMEKNQ